LFFLNIKNIGALPKDLNGEVLRWKGSGILVDESSSLDTSFSNDE